MNKKQVILGALLIFFLHENCQACVIAGAGAPSSGKTTIMGKLASRMKGRLFSELPEKDWENIVESRNVYGKFEVITFLRALRVSALLKAVSLAKETRENVFLDSFYDKIMLYYIGKPGHRWLIDKEDKYYKVLKQVALLDNQLLPDVDFVIFFKVSLPLWKKFMRKRSRKNDERFNITELMVTQEEILGAVKDYCRERGVQLIIYEQQEGITPEAAALILEKKLLKYIVSRRVEK